MRKVAQTRLEEKHNVQTKSNWTNFNIEIQPTQQAKTTHHFLKKANPIAMIPNEMTQWNIQDDDYNRSQKLSQKVNVLNF